MLAHTFKFGLLSDLTAFVSGVTSMEFEGTIDTPKVFVDSGDKSIIVVAQTDHDMRLIKEVAQQEPLLPFAMVEIMKPSVVYQLTEYLTEVNENVYAHLSGATWPQIKDKHFTTDDMTVQQLLLWLIPKGANALDALMVLFKTIPTYSSELDPSTIDKTNPYQVIFNLQHLSDYALDELIYQLYDEDADECMSRDADRLIAIHNALGLNIEQDLSVLYNANSYTL